MFSKTENTVGKCLLLNQIFVSPFVHIFDIISLFAAESEKPKVGILGKGIMFVKNVSQGHYMLECNAAELRKVTNQKKKI